jgi:GH25 family lysozyme M1 (1,4-beta-N-acetylmuramidase)
MHLPDVSYAQPDVVWDKVAKRNGGAAIVKATEGVTLVDALWAQGRRQSAHKHGISVLGIYHFLDADPDPVAQAKHFVATVGKLQPGEFAILDAERGAGNQLPRVKAFLDYVDRQLYGGHPGTWLYSGASFFQTAGLMPIAQGSRHTWVAAYGPTEPSVPHTLWQHTDREDWPGIGRCDCSIFHGNVDQLRAKLMPPGGHGH